MSPRGLLLATLVALAAPALGAPAPKPAPAAAAPAAWDWSGVDDRLSRGDWAGAALEIDAVLRDPQHAAHHGAAWGRLGDALSKAGMPYAALVAWAEGVTRDPAAVGPSYPDVIRSALDLSEQVWIGGLLGKDFSVPMSDETRSDVAWLSAKQHFAAEEWGLTLGLLPLVKPDSRFGVEATILRGVTLAQQGRHEQALEQLMAARDAASGLDDHARYVLDLNIARTFYALGNWGRAMEFFGRVPRSDALWPEAQFERAWAHFRADDMSGTIALLITHESPFFEDWYFPEGDLLRAQALFLMCKFPATTQEIDQFQGHYQPLLSQIGGALRSMDEAAAAADGRAAVKGEPTKLPASLLRRLQGDVRFTGSLAAIDVADADLEKLGRVGQAWTLRVTELLKARRDARAKEEGARILAYARDAEADLTDMLQGIELTRVDLLTFEADLYQRASVTGQLPVMGDGLDDLRKESRRKGKRLWPFQGEYWADELGWYKVTARPDCPAEMARGG